VSGGRVVTVSADQSQVSVDNTAPAANGTDVVNVSVTVKQDRDENGEPLGMQRYAASNVVLTVTPSTGVTITQPTGTADASGAVAGSFVSTNAATVSVGATAFGATVTGNASVVVGGGAPVGGGLIFTDTFAGGVKTNDNGFTWNSTTSAVSVQLAPDASGDYALRFRFGPDPEAPDPDSDSSAEQRFNIGQQLSELWLEYYVWVPVGFALRSQAQANNKFLALWPLNYSTIGDTYVVTEYDRNGTDTSVSRMLGYGDMFYADGTVIRGGDAVATSNFISAAREGEWSRIRVHYKLASGPGETDGVYEGWLGTTLMWRSRTDWVFWSTGGNNYVQNGYFFGWANSGFAAETDFYIRGGTNGPKFYDTDPGWTF
jgi:hypothetical protein